MKIKRLLSLVLVLLILLSTLCFSVSAAPDPRTKLAWLIGDAEQASMITGSNTTGESIEAVDKAIEEAMKVYLDLNATKEELDQQAEKVYTAAYNLKSYNVYTRGLWEALQFVKKLNPEDYTEQSFKALEEANTGFIYYPSSQKEVDDVVNAVNQAIANLIPIGSATTPEETPRYRIQRFVNKADFILHDYDTNYSTASEEKLEKAYNNAIAIIEASNSTDDMYLNAALNLEYAINGLVVLNWDIEDLNDTIIKARLMDYESDYTEESYRKFKDALYKAEEARYHAQSQEEVDKAADELLLAMILIEYSENASEYDKTEYSRFINLLFDARKCAEDGCYTADSLNNLADVIETCEQVEFNIYRDFDFFKDYADKLETAILALVPAEAPATTATVTMPASSETVTTEVIATTTVSETTEDVTSTTEPTEPTTATFDEPEETTSTSTEITTTPDKVTTSATAADTTPAETVSSDSFYILGDADQNLKLNIKDVTAIQKHIAKLTSLSDTGVLAGDCNEDGNLNIKDATELQKYIANLPANENIGKEFKTDSTPTSTNTIPTTEATLETSVTTATDTSSRDETPVTTTTVADVTEPEESVATSATDATEVTTNTEATTIAAETEATTESYPTESTTETTTEVELTTETIPVSDKITLYFTNAQNWEEVNVHYWNDNGDGTQWPGVSMEFVETNPYNQDVYKIAVPADIAGVVFNAGEYKPQTVDVLAPFKNNYGFYPEEFKDNVWTVGTYIYKNNIVEPVEINFKVIKEERIYEGYGSEETMIFIVNDSTDTEYKNYINGDVPEVDTSTLTERGKTLIVMLTFIGSGSNSQTIEKLEKVDDTLNILRLVRATNIGTADMNYRFVVLEVDSSDLEGITNYSDGAVYTYF